MVITINITILILSATCFSWGSLYRATQHIVSMAFGVHVGTVWLFALHLRIGFIWKWGILNSLLVSILGSENDVKCFQLESWRCFSMFHWIWIWSLTHWTPILKTVSNGIFRHAPRSPGSDFSTRSPNPTPVAMSEVVTRRYICVGSMGVYYVDKVNR